MKTMIDHSIKAKSKRFQEAIDLKMIAGILAIEAGMCLMAFYKGVGKTYLYVVLSMMVFTVIVGVIVNSLHASKNLFVVTVIMLNLGFLIQQITDYNSTNMASFLKKFIVAVVFAFVIGIIYFKISNLMERDLAILGMMLFQILCEVVMLVWGQFVGGSQGAIIIWNGITPFEIVKMLYIFVAAGLLNGEDRKAFCINGITIDREMLLVAHTLILSLLFIGCSELGTMMIVYITGLIMLWIFGENRIWINKLVVASIMGFVLVWMLCANVFLPLLSSGRVKLPGALVKIICRFGTALHPESFMHNYGYQGTNGLQAISIGGWLGIPAELYRVNLPEATNDFMFANIIQTCGVIMGFIVMLSFFVFLRIGFRIAEKSREDYLKRVASAISLVISIEALVHMGYNMAAFPITGIPLYFISQGFTAILTGMMLVAILLVISINQNKYVGG